MKRAVGIGALLVVASLCSDAQKEKSSGWAEYGGTLAGQRYSTARQIQTGNVGNLQVVWTFHTHALEQQSSPVNAHAFFEATPVLWNRTLYFDSPFDEIFALEAETGKL